MKKIILLCILICLSISARSTNVEVMISNIDYITYFMNCLNVPLFFSEADGNYVFSWYPTKSVFGQRIKTSDEPEHVEECAYNAGRLTMLKTSDTVFLFEWDGDYITKIVRYSLDGSELTTGKGYKSLTPMMGEVKRSSPNAELTKLKVKISAGSSRSRYDECYCFHGHYFSGSPGVIFSGGFYIYNRGSANDDLISIYCETYKSGQVFWTPHYTESEKYHMLIYHDQRFNGQFVLKDRDYNPHGSNNEFSGFYVNKFYVGTDYIMEYRLKY